MPRVLLRPGDCLDVMKALDADSVDAIVTDPPYDLTADKKGGTGAASLNLNSPAGRSRISTGGGFMGQAWDATGVAFDPATWREALRVLKPGGHLLAFGGTRTYHRMACAIEDAGFEVRDCLEWIYGTGFAKNANTQLKPSHEPIVLTRKALVGTVADNATAYGTGAINIEACRVPGAPRATGTIRDHAPSGVHGIYGSDPRTDRQQRYDANIPSGRWPPNLLLTHSPSCADGACAPGCPVVALDRQSGTTVSRAGKPRSAVAPGQGWGMTHTGAEHDDSGGASRFFPTFSWDPEFDVPFMYCAKAAKRERNYGLEDGKTCSHPTVKPVKLMEWLCKLVTPPDGLILDPFLGSGTTGIAAIRNGFRFIGVEREAEYFEIASARIRKAYAAWKAGGK